MNVLAGLCKLFYGSPRNVNNRGVRCGWFYGVFLSCAVYKQTLVTLSAVFCWLSWIAQSLS